MPQDVLPARRRTDSRHAGEETARCHIKTRKPGAGSSANATGSGWRNAARGACAPSAANTGPLPSEVFALHAWRGTGKPNAPATTGPGGRVQHTEAVAPKAAGAWRGRETKNAGANDARRASAPVAEKFHLSKEAPSARPAGRQGALKRGNSTPGGGPPGDAAGAVRKSSTRLRRAPRAPQGT